MQFYREEIQARKRLGYPPFNRLVRLEYRHLNESKAQQEARQAAEKIRVWISEENYSATDLIGPVPCYFARVNGMYRWQVILRGPNPVEILREHPLADWRIEVDPPNLL
jgi:primosomal protein N' (replication factor Y)